LRSGAVRQRAQQRGGGRRAPAMRHVREQGRVARRAPRWIARQARGSAGEAQTREAVTVWLRWLRLAAPARVQLRWRRLPGELRARPRVPGGATRLGGGGAL
jgi:hypothetical protein